MLDALFALLAGVVTVAAPCTLPVLPILLGTSLSSHNKYNKIRPLFIASGFIFSFAAVTLVFSAFTHVLGFEAGDLRNTAIVLLALFGLLMVWPQLYTQLTSRLAVFLTHNRAGPVRSYEGALGGLLLGSMLGLVWTPCGGPVLGSILTLIVTQPQNGWAGFLLSLYAIGAAIPMLAIAYGGQFAVTRVRSISAYSRQLQQVFGVLILGYAIAMYFQYDTLITAWLTQFYPSGQLGL